MKMRAGFQFHGRNPSETPAVAAAISGPTSEDSSVPLRTALKLKMKNAIDASPTNPAAKPSSPSMKLTALVMPITHTTVAMGATSRVSTTNSLVNGTRRYSNATPTKNDHRAGEDLARKLGWRR